VKILGFARMGGQSAVSMVRCCWPLRELDKRNGWTARVVGDDVVQQMMQENTLSQLEGFDLYQLTRIHGPGKECPFQEMKAQGAKFIYDLDDDLTGDYREFGTKEWVSDTAGWVDAITCSTLPLAKQMARYGKPVYVLPNYIDTGWYGRASMASKRIVEGLTVGLVGTATHFFDWGIVLRALEWTKQKFPEVKIVVGGYKPPFMDRIPDLVFLAPTEFKDYPALLRQIDIRLLPLDDDPFNESKSDVGALEAMAAARSVGEGEGGAVPIVSSGTAYESIQDGKTGLRCSSLKDWEYAIESLIVNEKMRNKLSQRGLTWVRQHRDLRHGLPGRVQVYKAVAGGKRG
jgi:glycosyltransferase involved in cell wall biosynthesis